MPRVHHRKARKDYPASGIKKGDMYYTWDLKTGPRSSITYRQLTPPKPWQLTSSPFLQEYYRLQHAIENLVAESAEDLEAQMENLRGEIEALAEETREKFDNMPEGLQQGDIGQLLEERADGLDSWVSDLEGVDLDFSFEEEEPSQHHEPDAHAAWEERKEEAERQFVEDAIAEIQGFDPGL